jgi:hypothetical protein
MSVLTEQLKKLKNRLEELENTPSELTKDALLADVRGFYDAVKALSVDEEVEVPAAPKQAPEVVASEQIDAPQETVEQAPVAEELPEPEVEPEPVAVVEIPEAEVEQPATESVAEKPSMIGNNDAMPKANDEKILAGQLGRKPLEDLRTGIPLNEKFGIIRGLFKGNASDYGDAVLKLNNAASKTEMQHYLDLLKQRFGWDVDSEAYQEFSVYVERKMLTLEALDANADQ